MNEKNNNQMNVVKELDDKVKENVKDAYHSSAKRYFQDSTILGKSVDISDLMGELVRQQKSKKDYIVAANKLMMTSATNIGFPTPQEEIDAGAHHKLFFAPTPLCHSQIADKLKIPKRYYDRMRDGHGDLLSDNVNHWLYKDEADKLRMIRTLDGKARAFVSNKFFAIDNIDVAYKAFDVIRNIGGQVVRADLTDNKFYIKAINPEDLRKPDWDPEGILGGCIVSNSEVGAGALNVEFFTYRLACANGFIGEKLLQRRHLGAQLEAGVYKADTIRATSKAVLLQLRDLVDKAFNGDLLSEFMAEVNKTLGVEISVTTSKLAEGNFSIIDMNDAEKDLLLRDLFGGKSGGMTQFGFMNAITAVARECENRDKAADFERFGYKVGTMNEKIFEDLVEVIVK